MEKSAKEIVLGYQRALGKGDWAGARRFLDDHLSFKGPFDTFERPEPYLDALKKLHPIVERVDMKKVMEDEDDVVLLYDMVTRTPAGTAFIAEWYRTNGDKIKSIQVVFDARPFAPMFEGRQKQGGPEP